MTTDGGGARREPLLLGLIGGLIGIVLAVVVFGGFLGPTSPVGASASPTTAGVASGGPTAGPSPSPAPTETTAPTFDVTLPPATVAPTAPPPPPPTSQPTPNTNPRIVSFDTPNQEDCTNATAGSVHLEWSIRNATGVTISIDGPGIYDSYAGLTGSVDLPYGCDFNVLQHTYTLTTVGGTGPAASVTRTIKTRAPSITSFTVSKPSCPTDSGQVGITMTYEIRAATGAELTRDEVLWSTYNGKQVTAPVMYDCSQNDQEFILTTTGGYGPEASKSIKVSKN